MKKTNPYANNSVFAINEQLARFKEQMIALQSKKEEIQRLAKAIELDMNEIRNLRKQADAALRFKTRSLT